MIKYQEIINDRSIIPNLLHPCIKCVIIGEQDITKFKRLIYFFVVYQVYVLIILNFMFIRGHEARPGDKEDKVLIVLIVIRLKNVLSDLLISFNVPNNLNNISDITSVNFRYSVIIIKFTHN